MTEAFNKEELKARRRSLRKNMPKAEVLLWCKLKNKQILGERFLRQYSVDQYVLDFYCPKLKLAIEIDGDSHFILGAEEQDKARQEHIEAFGIRFLRFTNEDVCRNVDGVCQNVYIAVDELRKR
ncbi:MAG: endonuclease domain-containing protein [Bacteroidota bacterium]